MEHLGQPIAGAFVPGRQGYTASGYLGLYWTHFAQGLGFSHLISPQLDCLGSSEHTDTFV